MDPKGRSRIYDLSASRIGQSINTPGRHVSDDRAPQHLEIVELEILRVPSNRSPSYEQIHCSRASGPARADG
jgi:hypothetical protein